MRRNVHEGEDVAVADVTSACACDRARVGGRLCDVARCASSAPRACRYCVLGLMGPRARELLSRVSSSDLSNAGFPFSTSREVDVGGRSVTAKRVTYVGELGWELCARTAAAAAAARMCMRASDWPRQWA